MSRPDGLKALMDYARGNAMVHSLFAMTYGALTIFCGDDLWSGGSAYRTANSIPFAPQSWGCVAIVFGGVIAIGCVKNKNSERWIRVGCFLMAVWCFVFAIFFLTDSIKSHTPFGLPGTAVYSYMAMLMIHRSVLSRRIQIDVKLPNIRE